MAEAWAVVLMVIDGGEAITCRAWQVPPEYFSRVEHELPEVGRPLPEWIWDSRTAQSVIISDGSEGGSA